MKYLSIDYGRKRVGIAISDAEGVLAFPYSVLENNKSLILEIKKIVEREDVGEIVIGESKNFQGEPNLIMQAVERFTEEIKKEIGLLVYLEPEFLTSFQAEKIQGKNDMLDASAASIILQSFLDKRKSGV